MKPRFDLTDGPCNTRFAPLCVLGHMLRTGHTLDPLLGFDLISMQSRVHTPGEKLLDAFLLILAGYPSLYLLNQHVRPGAILAQAWQRQGLADQSSVSRVLDAFDEPAGGSALAGLRSVAFAFWQAHSQLPQHDWRGKLFIDLDLTPLPASRRAEDSTKGYLGKKTPPDANSPA